MLPMFQIFAVKQIVSNTKDNPRKFGLTGLTCSICRLSSVSETLPRSTDQPYVQSNHFASHVSQLNHTCTYVPSM